MKRQRRRSVREYHAVRSPFARLDRRGGSILDVLPLADQPFLEHDGLIVVRGLEADDDASDRQRRSDRERGETHRRNIPASRHLFSKCATTEDTEDAEFKAYASVSSVVEIFSHHCKSAPRVSG